MIPKKDIEKYFLDKIRDLTSEALYYKYSPTLISKGQSSDLAHDNIMNRVEHLKRYVKDIGIDELKIDDAVKMGYKMHDNYVSNCA